MATGRRIKVVHSIPSLQVGGEETYLFRLANRLDPARFDQLVAFGFRDTMASEFVPHVRLLKYRETKARGTRLGDWGTFRVLRALFREEAPDVVAAYGAGVIQICTVAAAKSLGIPTVYTIQRHIDSCSRTEAAIIGVPPLRWGVWGCIDRFVALGTWYERDQRENWKVPAEKLVKSYIGIDLSEFRPSGDDRAAVRAELGLPPDVPVLGIVARLSPEKGIPRALTCVREIRRHLPEVQFLIVGDGPRRAEYEALVRTLDMTGTARLLGERKDVRRLLPAFDGLVQATYNPLNGIASIEAMATGIPVFTVVESQLEEDMAVDTCIDDRNGLYLRMDALEVHARRAAELLRDPARLRALGAESRRMALATFDLAHHVEEMAELYDALATRKARLHH